MTVRLWLLVTQKISADEFVLLAAAPLLTNSALGFAVLCKFQSLFRKGMAFGVRFDVANQGK